MGYFRHTEKESGKFGTTTFSEEKTNSTFSFTPSVGYFLADNLAIGLSLGYTARSKPYTKRTPAPTVVLAELDPTTTIQVGPYVQYYKMLSDQFGVIGTLGLGYQNVKAQDYSGGRNSVVQDFKGSGYYAGLTPGVIFFPIPKFGISASVGSLSYSRMSYDFPTNAGTTPDGYESTISDFGVGFGLDQLQFGGTYYFGR